MEVMSTLSSPPSSASPDTPRLDRSRHAAPQVLDYLREQIISLRLPPGSVLSRQDIATQFGLSQTPVRDALIHLTEEGLVDVFAQHKTVVSRIDVQAAQQAHFLRRSIEKEIARVLASQSDPALIKALEAIIASQQHALEAENYEDLIGNDRGFHRRMYDAAGVPDLYALVRRNSGHLDRLRRLHVPVPGKGLSVIEEHRRIVAAIASGDPDAAMRSVEKHLAGTLSWIDGVREQFPDYIIH
ncbi:GntR family transcriptional regulator [Propionivibrio dicarboxylicus]|uniref:DNA-binding transcriptional regulator, GntR family n=1 Tax=Propionivibrio dicarboxylicus TaxID=83767 RepID=A0A1G7XV92_9RHOO|nr:GntR family transcriptional regulator [Propionivibrio dicarboxylicus]SDG87956.1 DNA-binding transcriptional regulator, GntR family [Propionivibrio dicarboxylicus]